MADQKVDRGAEGEAAVAAAIAAMSGSDRELGQRVHEIVKTNAPQLIPRTWYGMPAYTNDEGRVICFFQTKQRFKTRYATLGFQHDAHLDDSDMWPVAYALTGLSDDIESRIAALVRQAVG